MSRYERTYDFPSGQRARGEEVKAEFDGVEQWAADMPDSDDVWSGNVNFAIAGGTANALTVTTPNTWLTYIGKEGHRVSVKIVTSNTGAVTISIDGLSVRPVVSTDGAALQAGDLKQNGYYDFIYNEALEKFYVATFTGLVQAAESAATAAEDSAEDSAGFAQEAEDTLDEFKGIYYGPLAADPALDPNGDAVGVGDFYFNTALTPNRFRSYDGSGWSDMNLASLTTFVFTADGGETSLSGIDDNGFALTYTPGFVLLYKDGVRLTPVDEYVATTGSTITGLAALTAGEVVTIDAFSRFTLSTDAQAILDAIELLADQVIADKALTAADVVEAGNQADTATAQAVIATAQAVISSDEADRAEVAADAAELSAGVYEDTAAGIAATAIGDYFSVPSAEGDEYVILYLHETGPVATEIKRYPSAVAVTDSVLLTWLGV